MQDNHSTATDEIVTIVEALKRLGKQAPTRQSFDAAVKRGKIIAVTDPENNPSGQRTVTWASVCAYIDHGGFRARQTSNTTTASVSDATLLGIEHAIPPSPVDSGVALTGNAPEPVKRRPAAKLASLGGKSKCVALHNRSAPKVGAPSEDSTGSKVRRTPALRTLKNSLRHLDFEQTKAIRDWADNRLLTVLRPAASLAAILPENTNPQHA